MKKRERRQRRKKRISKHYFGTKDAPRLSIFRSNKHVYVQVIDDEKADTILSTNDLKLPKKSKENKSANIKTAKEVGKMLVKKIKKSGIESMVFDRGAYKYHGKVKAIVETIRDAGIKV